MGGRTIGMTRSVTSSFTQIGHIHDHKSPFKKSCRDMQFTLELTSCPEKALNDQS